MRRYNKFRYHRPTFVAKKIVWSFFWTGLAYNLLCVFDSDTNML